MTKTTNIVYACVLVLIAALLAVGGVFDLDIANVVYQPENIIAQILQCVGYLPPFLFVGSTFAVLFFLVKQEDEKRTLKKVASGALVAVTYFVFGWMMSGEILTVAWQRALVGLGGALVLSPLTLLFYRGRKEEDLKRFEIFLIFASIVCVISSLVTINVVKFLWGRIRYREMIADGDVFFENFMPWYRPAGFSLHGHHSFPSGHTCSATNLLALCALGEVFPQKERNSGLVAFVVGMCIFVMAYSRLVLGAHFLSDVTAGFAVGFVTYAVARYVYFDKSRLVVTAIMKVNVGEEGEEDSEDFAEQIPAERVEIEIPSEEGEGADSVETLSEKEEGAKEEGENA